VLHTEYLGAHYVHLALRLATEPRAVRYESMGASPREAFLGRKLDGRRDFRCAFGDYVMATVPTTDNSMSARAEEYVVMLPLGNRTGSVKMQSPTSGRTVSRDQFKVIPMPASVIAAMNEPAMKDGRSIRVLSTDQYEPTASAPQAPSDLPDYITITPHTRTDPDIVLREEAATEAITGNLAYPPDGGRSQRYDAGRGVAPPPFPQPESGARSDPLFGSQEQEHSQEQPHHSEIRGDVEIRGEAESGSEEIGENTASCDGNTETGGDTIDTVNDVNDYGEGGERNEAVVMNNRRDLPEFFRRGKSHVALVASVKPDGDTKYRREGSSQD
jgi:hypothetical protein